MQLLRCLMLFAVMSALIRVPATAQASENWLDGDRLSWNFAGMAVPPAPVISTVPDSHCDSMIRPLEGVGDAEVANQGWRLYSAYEQAWGVSLISGLVSFDANCRPAYFQHFVFVDGVFAGTLAPDAMLPRLDGSLRDASVTGSESISAVYDRYTPDDGLCCPSSETWVTFSIERTPAGPIVVPQPAIEISTEQSELDQAAQRAVYFSQLEADEDYDILYTWMHADAQAIVPQEAVVGWYENEWAPSGPGIIFVTGVRFVDWTWEVTGKTYLHTAEVSFEQPFGDGSVVADVVRLVQDESGEWRWFFGRNPQFVDQQIALYASGTIGTDTSQQMSDSASVVTTGDQPPSDEIVSILSDELAAAMADLDRRQAWIDDQVDLLARDHDRLQSAGQDLEGEYFRLQTIAADPPRNCIQFDSVLFAYDDVTFAWDDVDFARLIFDLDADELRTALADADAVVTVTKLAAQDLSATIAENPNYMGVIAAEPGDELPVIDAYEDAATAANTELTSLQADRDVASLSADDIKNQSLGILDAAHASAGC